MLSYRLAIALALLLRRRFRIAVISQGYYLFGILAAADKASLSIPGSPVVAAVFNLLA